MPQSSEIVPDYFSDEEIPLPTASTTIKKNRGDSLVSKKGKNRTFVLDRVF